MKNLQRLQSKLLMHICKLFDKHCLIKLTIYNKKKIPVKVSTDFSQLGRYQI